MFSFESLWARDDSETLRLTRSNGSWPQIRQRQKKNLYVRHFNGSLMCITYKNLSIKESCWFRNKLFPLSGPACCQLGQLSHQSRPVRPLARCDTFSCLTGRTAASYSELFHLGLVLQVDACGKPHKVQHRSLLYSQVINWAIWKHASREMGGREIFRLQRQELPNCLDFPERQLSSSHDFELIHYWSLPVSCLEMFAQTCLHTRSQIQSIINVNNNNIRTERLVQANIFWK